MLDVTLLAVSGKQSGTAPVTKPPAAMHIHAHLPFQKSIAAVMAATCVSIPRRGRVHKRISGVVYKKETYTSVKYNHVHGC